MNVLLDTHILLWWLNDDDKLSEKARTIIRNPTNFIYISAATGWEIAIKKALGKLLVPNNIIEAIEVNDFSLLDITFSHTQLAGTLPPHHDDPFDRMLVAQAEAEELILITHDKQMKKYQAEILLV